MHTLSSKKKSLLLLMVMTFWATTDTQAIVGLDVSEFNFPSEGRKGLRVIQFDTKSQKFKKIDYFAIQGTQARPVDVSFTYPDIPGLSLHTSGKVTVAQDFDLTKFMVRTKGTITAPDAMAATFQWKDFESHSIIQKSEAPLAQDKVVATLKAYTGKKKDGNAFSVSLYHIGSDGKIKKGKSAAKPDDVLATFSSISTAQQENNDERGKIGELATALTMIDFGYQPFSSKYEDNHGFDGVFQTRDNKSLFLTESKCRNEPKSAAHYLTTGLNEKKLYETLNIMRATVGVVQQSAGEIDQFIMDGPDSIYKFAHRIKPDGTCQCAVEGFSLTEYTKCLPAVVVDYTDEGEQVELMRETCEKMGASPEKSLEALMKALNLTSEDVRGMLAL